jgi:hypothetical protein
MDVDLDCVDLMVAHASWDGTVYKADARLVHNLILVFFTGQNAEQWIKRDKAKCDYRFDMVTLVDHYSGAGNAICQTANAQKLEKNLHYKNEQSMPFEKFLVRCCNGYVSSVAKIASIRESVVGKCEFDSHANTCVVGKN